MGMLFLLGMTAILKKFKK